MRILFVSDAYIPVPSGVAVSMETLKISLEKLGSQVFVVAPKYSFWKKRETGVARLPGIFKPFHRYRPHVWPVLGLDAKKLKEFKIDLVHSHFFFQPFNYAHELAHALNVPLVNTFYKIFPENEKLASNFRFVRDKKTADSILKTVGFANRCDHLVALSDASKKYLNQLNISTPIDVIPVGVFPKDFTSYPPEAIRRKFKIPSRRKIILYVGSMNQEGEVRFLLRSFRRVWKALDDVHLLIIGGGEKLRDYKFMAARSSMSKFVTFTGYLPKNQVNRIYGTADVLAYPGRLDPQPLVIVESLVAGTPVVAVKGLGGQEFVKNDQDGFVTEYEIEDFADKLIEILRKDQLRLDFSLKARINARKYRTSILTRELLDLYGKLIENHKNKII